MWIAAAVMGLFLVLVIGLYNSLVYKRNQVRNIFATMDALLKKRWDLVPNLAATVKGYMEHERNLLREITEARARAARGGLSRNERVEVDNLVSRVFGQFFAVAEAYPQLKASANFLHLQRTLVELEEQISAARRAYNAAVTDYNNAIQMFPTNLLAGTMNFREARLFEIPADERQPTRVRTHVRGDQ